MGLIEIVRLSSYKKNYKVICNTVTTHSVSTTLKAMWHKASENNVLLSGNKYNVGACRYLKKALANIEIFEKGHFRLGHINYL